MNVGRLNIPPPIVVEDDDIDIYMSLQIPSRWKTL